jgi:pimeloyl-ACP methyl ester carboxylesterase
MIVVMSFIQKNAQAVVVVGCLASLASTFPTQSVSDAIREYFPGSPPSFAAGYPSSLAYTYYPPDADCTEYTVPITISSEDLVFNATAAFETDYDVENFLSVAETRPSANFPGPFADPVTTKGSYNIAASFCTPKAKNGKEKTVILATHGIGPARDHWNPAYKPDQYNFVQWATGQGYSVFFYDRLGCGQSDK